MNDTARTTRRTTRSDLVAIVAMASVGGAASYLASSAIEPEGLFVQVAFAGLIAVGCVGAARGRKRLLFGAVFAALLIASIVAGVELTLRAAPDVIRGRAANAAFSGYHAKTGGLYERDEWLGHRIRAGRTTNLFWNGRWWNHRANAWGGRGREVVAPKIILLGDSLVHGHGVEEEDTLAARLETFSGLRVLNLAQQAACPVQSWRRFAEVTDSSIDSDVDRPAVKPRFVFLCLHPNDAADAVSWYGEEELTRFIAGVVEFPRTRAKWRPSSEWDFRAMWDERLRLPLYSTGLFAWLRRHAFDFSGASPISTSAHAVTAPANATASTGPSSTVGVRANKEAIRRLHRRCEAIGTTLVLFDLGLPGQETAAAESLARELGIGYSPAGRVAFDQSTRGESIYLVDDGHWTPEGHAVVAKELAKMSEGRSAPRRRNSATLGN